MFWFLRDGDPDWVLMGTLLSLMTGVLCGAGTVAVGLLRGHRTLAWTGGAVCAIVGLGCFLVAVVPAGAFIGIMLLTEPIEARRRRRRTEPSRTYADREYAPAYGTRTEPRRERPADPPPKPRPAAVDEAPDVVEDEPFEFEESQPIPAVHPVLAEIRTKLGPTPRWFPEDVLNTLTVRRPDWVGADELDIVLRDQRAVLAMGEVFWGAWCKPTRP